MWYYIKLNILLHLPVLEAWKTLSLCLSFLAQKVHHQKKSSICIVCWETAWIFYFKLKARQRQGSVGECRHWIIIYLEKLNNQLCADFSKAFVKALGATPNIIFSPLLIIKENKVLKLLKNMELASKQLLFNAFKRQVFEMSLNISKVKDQLFLTGCFLNNQHKVGRKANRQLP